MNRDYVRGVQEKLACTLYGYFVGDRIVFPVVDYFARLQCKKFGLQKVMMNAQGFFFFKFDGEKGMLEVLKGGPWLIRSNPILLNKWTTSTQLKKEEMKRVAVWIKLHDVPIATYTDDGLSMLVSKIGTPKLWTHILVTFV